MQPWLLALMRLRMHFEPEGDGEAGPHPWHPLPERALEFDSRYALTEREREVSQLMLGGSSTKEIARRLAISVETVRAHKKHLYAKLGSIPSRAVFAVLAGAPLGLPRKCCARPCGVENELKGLIYNP